MVGCSVCDLSHPRNVGISELFSASLDGIDTGLEYQADTTFRHARLAALEVVRRLEAMAYPGQGDVNDRRL